ncbi:heterokaryon incompatibility protein-domain-containing protein [Aspergillus granulosus]|uniref:Heterokaryon incompatibility protein-domain-containing protein n=1 Tax=Aspergillus granulosus TaxID=176169 RepID=A0ABR4HU81_9EURO
MEYPRRFRLSHLYRSSRLPRDALSKEPQLPSRPPRDALSKEPQLPNLPPKSTVTVNHLTFREPDLLEASKKRERSLEEEIRQVQDKIKELKQEHDKLEKESREELNWIQREQRRAEGFRNARGRDSERLLDLLRQTKEDLESAIEPDDDQVTGEEEEDIHSQLERAQASLERDQMYLDRETVRGKLLHRELSAINEEIHDIEAEIKKKCMGEPNDDTMVEHGEDVDKALQENLEEQVEEQGQQDEGATQEENCEGLEKQNPKQQMEEKKQREAREEEELRERVETLESELTKKTNEEEKCKQDKETFQNKVDEQKKKVKYLKDQKTRLEDKRKREHEEEEEDDRRRREENQDQERFKELNRRIRREGLRDDMRIDLLRAKYRSSVWGDDELVPLKRHEDIFSQVEKLESRLVQVLHVKERLARARDLKNAFEREISSEQRLRDDFKESPASKSTTVDDHFSSSVEGIYESARLEEQDQIRLLILYPAPNKCYPLICGLTKKSLKDKPKYVALSYFWGGGSQHARLFYLEQEPSNGTLDPESWGTIARDARRIPIRNNLLRALLQLRRDDVPVHLWVDLMCINQTDKNEKTAQLPRMVNVYRMAEHVCVWLGEADSRGNSRKGMEFITKIMDFATLERFVKDKDQADNWLALAELMRDRWFSRRWVVQEISLAKSASVHCGSEMVQWADFADAVSILVSSQDKIRKLFDFERFKEGPDTLGEVQSFGANILLEATSRLFLRTASGGIVKPVKTLESLVTSLKTFNTSDQRDLIYSLVSIASDSYNPAVYAREGGDEKDNRNSNSDLVVTYHVDEIEVYKSFVRFCINASGSLDILCRPWAMPLKEPLPTWIRSLRDSEFGEPEKIYEGRKNGDSLVGPVGQPRYKASGDRKHENTSTATVPLPYLSVKGFILAQVAEPPSMKTTGVIGRDSLQKGGWPGINNSPECVPDRIWRTLIADRDADGQHPPTWYQRACLRCLEMADIFNNGDLNIGQLLQGPSDTLRVYLTRVRNTTWNRKFFVAKMKEPSTTEASKVKPVVNGTEGINGEETPQPPAGPEGAVGTDEEEQLFGLCPRGTNKNDLICILFGCSVPVILRYNKERHRYSVIGEAYVHGKMDGEAMEDYQSQNTLSGEQTFELE